MEDERAQELYAKFMQLQQQVQELKGHFEMMQHQLQEIEKTRETITTLSELTTSTETWVPIAPGAYVRATLSAPKTVLINVGANIAVEKKPDDVASTLSDHSGVLEELSDAALAELKQSLAELDRIRAEVESHTGG